jgi:hypothetical protein
MHMITRTLIPAAAALAVGLAASGAAHASDIGQVYSTPGRYIFTVPAGVTSLHVRVAGAGGGQDAFGNRCDTGSGAVLSGEIPVLAGETLDVGVGGVGGDATGSTGGVGGAPGGGHGGSAGPGGYGGGGGGGSSQLQFKDVALVAGGGGGCGGAADGQLGHGGNDGTAGGGGNIGADGQPAGGGAPAASQAGGASSPSTLPAGEAGDGPRAGAGADGPYLGGGGGGGGELGGGGGGGSDLNDGIAGGGAGGSDLVAIPASKDGLPSLEEGTGSQAGNGVVSLSWSQAGTGVGDLFAPTTAFDAHETLLGDGGSPLRQLSGTPSWTIPSDGVITSWAYEAGPDAPLGVELKVAGASGDGEIVDGASSTGAISADSIALFPARTPVQAGEEIGVAFHGTADVLPVSGAGVVATAGDQNPGDPARAYGPITPDGAPLGFNIGPGAAPQGAAVPIEAFVEPDTDHDGFGDTTQDQCPGVYGSAEGCPDADLGVSSSGLGGDAMAGDTLSETFTVTDHGPDPVGQATLTIAPDSGAQVVAATPSTAGGQCSSGAIIVCTLGPLGDAPSATQGGDSATVRVLLRATAPGRLVDTATVAGPAVPASIGAGDPNPANNSASDAVTVTPAAAAAGGSSPTGTAAAPTSTSDPDAPGSGTGSGTGSGSGSGSSAPGPRHLASPFRGARVRGAITVTGRRATLTVTSAAAARGTVTLSAPDSVAGAGHPRAGTMRLGRARFAVATGRPARIRLVLGRTALARLRAHRDGIRVRVTVTSRSATGSSGPVTTSTTARLRLTRERRR